MSEISKKAWAKDISISNLYFSSLGHHQLKVTSATLFIIHAKLPVNWVNKHLSAETIRCICTE